MEDKKQPIVVKKVVKIGARHGGAWKVAYADFVTAMMAFFLLLWLLGSTTPEQKAGISEFFRHPDTVEGPGGASTSMIDLGGAMELPQDPPADPSSQEELAARLDQQRLEALRRQLLEAVEQSQALKPFKDQLLIDITPEGLRIQIVDKENRPMFDLGSAELKWYTADILAEIAAVINQVPNKVSITGHTDARQFARVDYTNWELSADRANAARRALIAGGMQEEKIGRVVGLASTVLFDKTDPYNPVNRRISIIVMNTAAAESLQQQAGRTASAVSARPRPQVP